jgi:hypothetical protein
MSDMLMRPEPVDLVVLTKEGRVLELNNCIGLKFDKYKGTRRIKMLTSGEIRTVRDILIMSINGCEVMI